MSGKGREIAIGFCAAFAAAFVPLAVAPANASKPVPKTIVGCVFKGKPNLIRRLRNPPEVRRWPDY